MEPELLVRYSRVCDLRRCWFAVFFVAFCSHHGIQCLWKSFVTENGARSSSTTDTRFGPLRIDLERLHICIRDIYALPIAEMLIIFIPAGNHLRIKQRSINIHDECTGAGDLWQNFIDEKFTRKNFFVCLNRLLIFSAGYPKKYFISVKKMHYWKWIEDELR